ncbi:hypothetical protein PIB30_006601 [Stylosanthes scabra]|uniref:Uncharacterized protein n=1 Tax=Stylosanthes scabra TaxID=79078 RepID=A0ABU6Z219_9FABA|nr:hypothetical protein [Stylosanthes scabra]
MGYLICCSFNCSYIATEDERSPTPRLSRLKSVATALAERHADGLLPVKDFNIEVEDQSGKKGCDDGMLMESVLLDKETTKMHLKCSL